MKCPECTSDKVKVGAMFRDSGNRRVPADCEACGYHWSPAPPVAAVEVVAAPAPAAPTSAPETASDFNASDVKDGDRCLASYKGEEVEVLVNDVTAKTVVCEIAGEPDIRIKKSQLLGLLE